MERLTVNKLGSLLINCGNGQYESPCYGCERINTCDIEADRVCELYRVVERLKEYEDLEEQGKLLKLPCKIGDTVFTIPSKVNYKLNVLSRHEELNRVCELIVNRIEISEYGYLLSVCDGMENVLEQSFKETWFLTREEADTVLKEMENETN